MAQGPAGLGVQVEVEIRRLVSQYLIGFELVEAQQPVSLVEAVLPQERRLGDGRQVRAGHGRDISRIIDALQFHLIV